MTTDEIYHLYKEYNQPLFPEAKPRVARISLKLSRYLAIAGVLVVALYALPTIIYFANPGRI